MRRYLKGLRKRIAPHWTDIWPDVIARTKTLPAIQLGSGVATKLTNSINVDINSKTHPDVIYELNRVPYPFRSNSFMWSLL